MSKKPSWGLIILGIAIFIVIVGVGLVAVAGFVIYQQFGFQATPATALSAEQEIKQLSERFAGDTPLLEMRDGEPVIVKEPGRRHVRPVEALHVLVWQPDERKMVRLSIPFWLLRMTKGHPIKLSGGAEGEDVPVRLRITAEDLERHGPGLILDYKGSLGEHVLIWAQ